MGPSNLLDWGSYDWQDSTPLDPTKPGGPGSFEQALELVVMQVWDHLASAPQICDIIRASGLSPNLTDIATGSQLQGTIWATLATNVGALVPIFLAGWNAGHTTGEIVTPVPCTQAMCEEAGGTWIASDGSCGSSGGSAVPCNQASPAPQRTISYVVGSAQYNDPLSVAYEALAQIQGIPAGKTLVLQVNSGPATTSTGGWRIPTTNTSVHVGGTGQPPTPQMSAGTKLAIVGGTAVVAGMGALLYSWLVNKSLSYVVDKAFDRVIEEAKGLPRAATAGGSRVVRSLPRMR
jgi:hypothetical protein